MQAVILAAGLGTRMGELTKDVPKPLLKMSGEDISMLERNLQTLPDEVDEVIIVVGYLKEQIQKQIGNEYDGKKITYVEQKELKGTGHALSLCKDYLNGKFLVLMADDLYKNEDLAKLAESAPAILVYRFDRDDPNDFQAPIETDGQGNWIGITERQSAEKGMVVNTGAYCLDMSYFELPLQRAGNKTEEYGLPQTMLQLKDKGRQIRTVQASWWHKISAPKDLEI